MISFVLIVVLSVVGWYLVKWAYQWVHNGHYLRDKADERDYLARLKPFYDEIKEKEENSDE